MLPDSKERKIVLKPFDCMFISYSKYSFTYRFIAIKSDILAYNTIIEIKNNKIFKNIIHLKSEKISHELV